MKVNFGFDWDGTVDRAPDEFLAFAKSLVAAGHGVYVVTMRYASEVAEIEAWRPHVTDVIFTNRRAKHKVCEENGINITVWIEDNPKAVHMDAMEIWGFCTPEGFVHRNPVLESESIHTSIVMNKDIITAYSESAYVDFGEIDHHATEKAISNGFLSQHQCIFRTNMNTKTIALIENYTGRFPLIPIHKDTAIDLIEIRTVSALAVLCEIHTVFS